MTGIEETQPTGGGSSTDKAEPEQEEDFPWHDDTLSIDERMELATDKPIGRQMMAAMAQLDCGSCGYLCQTYSEAIASGLSYEVGDALGLYPTNCSDLIEEVLALGIYPDDCSSAHNLLMTRDLATVTDELCESVSATVANDVDRRRMNQLIDDEDQLDELDVLDMLQLFDSVQLPATELIKCLPELNPRLYSIASSIKQHPNQVHLTVGKVTHSKRERLRKGVASTLLAERVEAGSTLKVFTQKSHGFTIPADDQVPIIMVGPGTGIAPFIAFLQEREARAATGDNWLFFGDQRSETDFLYRQQLEDYLESGRLTRLSTAFSRDQKHKVYVQDRMRENSNELFNWLNLGAVFYVCGDASRMAKDVDQALHKIVQEQGQLSESDSKRFVKQLKDEGRYMRDVY